MDRHHRAGVYRGGPAGEGELMAPILFPQSLDDLLSQRRDAATLSVTAWLAGHGHAIIHRQDAWMDRLSARAARIGGAA